MRGILPADCNIDLPGGRDIPSVVAEVVRRVPLLADCEVDHVAFCVEAINFDRHVRRLSEQLPAASIREYRVGDADSGMRTAEIRDAGRSLHLVLSAPLGDRGQIATFLSRTGREGLQHIAFSVPDVATSVKQLAAEGLCFVGGTDDPQLAVVEVEEDGTSLRQAFTEPLFGEFFVEIIERNGITEMRTENIRALYEMNEAARRVEAAPA